MLLDTGRITLEALEAYDKMMLEVYVQIEKIAPLSIAIWTDVLKELDRRGKVKLTSGSYEDPGNSLIFRL